MTFQQLIRALQQIRLSWSRNFIKRSSLIILATFFITLAIHSVNAQNSPITARPKVILISLDGATPGLLNQYFSTGVINPNKGLGLLKSRGIIAQKNQTCSPSLIDVTPTINQLLGVQSASTVQGRPLNLRNSQ